MSQVAALTGGRTNAELWGCDCPLPALAACHRRGKVCSRLSLFSPLFCARAWRCLRLGLTFRVVDIPQSGVAPDPAESRGAPPPPQDPSPLRGMSRSGGEKGHR